MMGHPLQNPRYTWDPPRLGLIYDLIPSTSAHQNDAERMDWPVPWCTAIRKINGYDPTGYYKGSVGALKFQDSSDPGTETLSTNPFKRRGDLFEDCRRRVHVI